MTISCHATQISDFLRYRKIKVTDFSEVAKFWKVLINFHKAMTIIKFYANYLKPCLNMLEYLVSVLLHSCCITLISLSTRSFTDVGNST